MASVTAPGPIPPAPPAPACPVVVPPEVVAAPIVVPPVAPPPAPACPVVVPPEVVAAPIVVPPVAPAPACPVVVPPEVVAAPIVVLPVAPPPAPACPVVVPPEVVAAPIVVPPVAPPPAPACPVVVPPEVVAAPIVVSPVAPAPACPVVVPPEVVAAPIVVPTVAPPTGPAPGVLGAAAAGVRESGVVIVPTAFFGGSFPFTSGVVIDWWNMLTSRQAPGWGNLTTVYGRFLLAFSVNTMKAMHLGTGKGHLFSNKERVTLSSYMEAIFLDNCAIISATWNGTSPFQVPAVVPGMFSLSTGLAAGASTVWDEMIFNYGAQPTGTLATAYFPAMCRDATMIAVNKTRYLNAQFTFVLSLAKKGDMSGKFSNRAISALRDQMNLRTMEVFHLEFAWLALFVVRNCGFTKSSEWKNLFDTILQSSAGSERVQTILSWAQSVGLTRLYILKKGIETHPSFCWNEVENHFPGEIADSIKVYKRHQVEPYVMFLNLPPSPAWPVDRYYNAAHIASLVLTATGDSSIAEYKGFMNHNLYGAARWRHLAREYATAIVDKIAGGLSFDAKVKLTTEGMLFV